MFFAHDVEVAAGADWIVALGPGAGHDGGEVVFEGPPAELVEAEHSLTGQHLRLHAERARGREVAAV
jgi:excinuclease UvrABC ATPase subunit